MSFDPWQTEMNKMLEIIEQQSEMSLRKINQRFQQLNRGFTPVFRDYFTKMSMQRLEISYTKVEMEQWNMIQARSSDTASVSGHDRQSINSDTTNPMVVVFPDDSPNPLRRVIKNEVAIEIQDDGNSDRNGAQSGNQTADELNKNSVQGAVVDDNGNVNGPKRRNNVKPVIRLDRCDTEERAKGGANKTKQQQQQQLQRLRKRPNLRI